MKVKSSILILATTLLVTVPLLYFAFSPINLIHIQIRPLQNYGTRILSSDTFIRSDRAIIVFFDFRAYVENPSISEVRLDIRPSAEPVWYQQENYYVSNGFVMGTAQLGSREWPVKQTEQYTFRLVAADGSLLSEGQINAVVDQIAGSESWLIGGIGAFASLLQIVSTVLEARRKQS